MSMEILTGNELTSGGTVYLDLHGNWVEDLQAARLFAEEEAEARDAALAASKATGRIISLEIEEVTQEGGRIVPKRLRERIRAAGPTAPLTLNGQAYDRQHLGEDGHVSI
jgi:bacterioferritin (cytochrome b1)